MSNSPPEDFFVAYHYAAKMNRRKFYKAFLGFGALGAFSGLGWSMFQRSPGDGSWESSKIISVSGFLEIKPYPVLWTDHFGKLMPVLLYCLGKCGAQTLLSTYQSGHVKIYGSVLKRRGHYALTVAENQSDWIKPIEDNLTVNQIKPLEKKTDLTLKGEILDSKCWFGSMRPGEGKAHKSCAVLCVLGGIAPALFVTDDRDRSQLLIITDKKGQALTHSILSYIADPIQITGTLYTRINYFEFRIDPKNIIRL